MEEIEKSVSPILAFLDATYATVWQELGRLLTVSQVIGLAVALILAVIVNRRVRRIIDRVGKRFSGRVWQRMIRTASAISLPIAWVIGLWITLAVLGSLGEETALVRLAASLINAFVVIRIVSTLIPSAFWANAFAWLAWTVAALNALGYLDRLIRWLDSVSYSTGTIHISLWGVLQGGLVTGLLVWAAFVVSRLIQNRLEKSSALNPSMRVLTGKILRITLVAVAVVFGMQAVGINLTAFTVFSGALGLGVGLGMQRTVSNLVAGFTMLADRSIKPGDVIEIETATGPTYGEVRSLGARYVSVLTRSGTETLIPNEILISSAVTNWSFSNRLVRRGLAIGVSYHTDVELAQRLCVEAALKCSRVLKKDAPVCLLKGFGDSSVDLELRFWISDPEGGVANIESEVLLQVWKLFTANKIEIPYPQRDLHIRSGLETFARGDA